MINAGMVGLGWWGQTLVESVTGSERIKFRAATTRTLSDEARVFATDQELTLHDTFEDMLADPTIDAVVLATPHSLHTPQIVAASRAGKHVFCEKPLALTKADADQAIEATLKAGVTLGLGYNRRLHPEMIRLREMIESGELGTILHIESNMTFPNALFLKADAWRGDKKETPCGGLTPMGVHAVDGMIDLCGEIDEVYCQSFRRVIQVDADDTTSMLFRMKDGSSGYLGTMTATGGGFSFHVFGSKGHVRLEGMTHVAGAPSEERRMQLFGKCSFKPVKGPARNWDAAKFDVVHASLEAFATAAQGGKPFPIPLEEMVHGVAVTEAVVQSAQSHEIVKVDSENKLPSDLENVRISA